jgi:hypothetical protein
LIWIVQLWARSAELCAAARLLLSM